MAFRDITSAPNGFSQPIIAGAFFHEKPEASIGDRCPGVIDDRAQDLVIAGFNQLIGNSLTDLVATSDRQPVLLPLLGYAIDESIVIQCIRSGKNGFGDFYGIVERKGMNGVSWGVIKRRKSLRKLRASGDVDFCNENLQDIIVECYLICRIMPCAQQKQIGDLVQHRTGFGRASSNCLFDIGY